MMKSNLVPAMVGRCYQRGSLAEAPCRTEVLAGDRTCGSGDRVTSRPYGPHMEVGTIVLLFVWLVIAEIVVTKLVNDPE